MSYYVYILYSESLDQYYKGSTSDLEDRLHRHNSGYEKSTRSGVPWRLVLLLKKATKGEAFKLEKKLKNMNRNKLEQFIRKYEAGSSRDAE